MEKREVADTTQYFSNQKVKEFVKNQWPDFFSDGVRVTINQRRNIITVASDNGYMLRLSKYVDQMIYSVYNSWDDLVIEAAVHNNGKFHLKGGVDSFAIWDIPAQSFYRKMVQLNIGWASQFRITAIESGPIKF